MYCPKCSLQQVSDDVRFCSRCGYQLGIVRELPAESADAFAAAAELRAPKRLLSHRKQDLLFGATFMYVAAVMTVLVSVDQPKAPIIFPLGMVWVAFSLFVLFFDPLVSVARKLFSDYAQPSGTRLPSRDSNAGFITRINSRSPALLPTHNIPATVFGSQRVNTAEMVQPPSVTEQTTTLLDKDKR